jgi:hypothetical protein
MPTHQRKQGGHGCGGCEGGPHTTTSLSRGAITVNRPTKEQPTTESAGKIRRFPACYNVCDEIVRIER